MSAGKVVATIFCECLLCNEPSDWEVYDHEVEIPDDIKTQLFRENVITAGEMKSFSMADFMEMISRGKIKCTRSTSG